MKALMFTDIHLQKERLKEQKSILKFILRKAIENKVEAVFFLGDAYHERKKVGSDCTTLFFRFVKNLNANKISFLAISGNHDKQFNDAPYSSMTPLNFGRNMVVDYKFYQEGNCYFIPFLSEELIMKMIKMNGVNKEVEYLFMHTGFDNTQVNENYLSKGKLKQKFIKKYFPKTKKIFCGHYHDRVNKGIIKFIGSPLQRKHGEEEEKGIYLLDTVSGGIIFIRTKFPLYKKFVLDCTAQSFAKAMEIVSKEKGNYVWLKFVDDKNKLASIPYEKIKERSEALELKTTTNAKEAIDVDDNQIDIEEKDIIESFIEYAKQESMKKPERIFGVKLLKKVKQ